MDAITVTSHDVDFLRAGDLLYLYCIDFVFAIDFNPKELPFLNIQLIGGHISFPNKLCERRIVLFPKCQKIQDLRGKESPCVIEVNVCCRVEVESDPQTFVVLIWDFQVKDNLPASAVKPLTEYEGDNPYPHMPWLNISNCECNCTRFPVAGEILQDVEDNVDNYVQNDSLDVDDHDESDGARTPDEDDDDRETTCNELQYTETYKLKGTSFHAHFQEALRKYKQSQLSGIEPELKNLFEPVNKRDENAVLVQAKYHEWEPIGYVPGVRVKKVTDAFTKREITKLKISKLNREYNHGVGARVYVAYISVSKKGGRWPTNSDGYKYNCIF